MQQADCLVHVLERWQLPGLDLVDHALNSVLRCDIRCHCCDGLVGARHIRKVFEHLLFAVRVPYNGQNFSSCSYSSRDHGHADVARGADDQNCFRHFDEG